MLSSNIDMLTDEKVLLGSRFKVKHLGEMHYILGMCVKRDRKSRTLSLSQPKYFEGILKRFNMDKCKPVPHLWNKSGNFSICQRMRNLLMSNVIKLSLVV